VSGGNYWFAIGVLGNVTNYVRYPAVYLLQHWRKRGANKIYWWVISGKCLQDKYQKYNFIGEDCKAKCTKIWKWVQHVKSVTTSTFESTFVLPIGFIAKAWCSISSRRATRGGHLGHLPPPEIFKTLPSNFDICRNFQTIKLKFCIFIIFKKSFT